MAILTIALVFLGAKYRKWLSRDRLFIELFDDIVAAAEDDKVSEEESILQSYPRISQNKVNATCEKSTRTQEHNDHSVIR